MWPNTSFVYMAKTVIHSSLPALTFTFTIYVAAKGKLNVGIEEEILFLYHFFHGDVLLPVIICHHFFPKRHYWFNALSCSWCRVAMKGANQDDEPWEEMKMMNKSWRGAGQKTVVDPGYLMLAVYLMSVVVLVLLAWCGTASAVAAEKTVSLSEVQRGELLMPGKEPGHFLQASLLSMDVDIAISGITARTTVVQHFINETEQWIEALYVFPLPDESAVDHMQMQIGNRKIIGDIQEKKQARKTYEDAKKAGKKTSLLSQQRPNIFTTAVANIGPGETVTIEIEYQQMVQRRNKVYSLRFPMVVGPRYQPGTCPLPGPAAISSPEDKRDKLMFRSAAEAVGKDSIFPPVAAPGEQLLNPVNLHVDLAAGMKLARVDSLYHGIRTVENSSTSLDIQFTGEVRADRDFVLEWEPEPSQAPTVTLFSEQKGQDNFMLLMVMPPEQQTLEPLPRETVFILDTSGSMGGESIRQAKKALLLAVARMRPTDRFNVIEFNTTARSLFSASRAGTTDNIAQARSFVEQLEADGGTEIRPALELALDGRSHHERIRQVVFLTDACISNEQELLRLIHDRLGDSRLFMVGIGSAPNSYFMTRAAAMGRGSNISIGKLSEVQEKMTALFSMLEQPALVNITLHGGNIVESYPSPLPDLYQGEPLIAVLKGRGEMQNMQLSGLMNGATPWQVKIAAENAVERPGISVLWARKKIRSVMDTLSAGGDPEIVKEEVTAIALDNHLVSRYTSLVAVEQKISRPENADLQTSRQQTNLPAGWQYDSVFAGSAATATWAELFMLMGLFLLMVAGVLAGLQRRQL